MAPKLLHFEDGKYMKVSDVIEMLKEIKCLDEDSMWAYTDELINELEAV